MCGEGSWKGVTVFCLAFWIGIFIANDFTARDFEMRRAITPVSENVSTPDKKCVPLDESLKYRNLTQEPKKEAEKQPKAKNKSKEDKATLKKSAESQPQYYVPSKDSAEYKNLLHKEKCYESDGRK